MVNQKILRTSYNALFNIHYNVLAEAAAEIWNHKYLIAYQKDNPQGLTHSKCLGTGTGSG